MPRNTAHRIAAFIVLLALSLPVHGQERDRNKIPDKYKWNLADIYPTEDAWKKAKDQLVAGFPAVNQFKGKLGSSAKELLACLDFNAKLAKEYARLYVYASMLSDQDTRDAAHLALTQEIRQVGADFGAKTAFIEPEILKADRKKIDSFLKEEKKLDVYRQYLDDLFRRNAHTGTEAEEKILADASLVADGPSSINGIFSNAEFPFPEVTLSDGKTVKLDKAAFNLYRAVPNRDDRRKVFAAFFNQMNRYKGSTTPASNDRWTEATFLCKCTRVLWMV
jgi:oligoendopeptidase F